MYSRCYSHACLIKKKNFGGGGDSVSSYIPKTCMFGEMICKQAFIFVMFLHHFRSTTASFHTRTELLSDLFFLLLNLLGCLERSSHMSSETLWAHCHQTRRKAARHLQQQQQQQHSSCFFFCVFFFSGSPVNIFHFLFVGAPVWRLPGVVSCASAPSAAAAYASTVTAHLCLNLKLQGATQKEKVAAHYFPKEGNRPLWQTIHLAPGPAVATYQTLRK